MVDKTAYHPDGIRSIRFQERYHTYTDNYGTRYTSGTSFIRPFFPKFDAISISIKCAAGTNPLYAGRDPKDIRAEWWAEAQRGSSEGDNVHEYAEFWASPPGQSIKPISARCALLFKQVDIANRVLLAKGFILIANEMIVFSPGLKIAGTVDKIMWDPATQEIIILDWKQNKEIKYRNQYKKNNGLFPIEHLEGSDISKYTLQLSLYQYIIIRENYFPQARGYRRALIHLLPDNVVPIKLEYFEYEILELIKFNKGK